MHGTRPVRTAAAPIAALAGAAALAVLTAGCAPAAVSTADGPPSAAAQSEGQLTVDPRGRLPVEGDEWTARFDDHFRKYSKRFFSAAFDWRWFKAQGITESSLREDATSRVGAKGIMQLMPATFAEIAAQASIPVSGRGDPRHNIAAGVFYDRRLYDLWDDIPERMERLAFAFASYNGGRSRVLRAQDRCAAECAEWVHVMDHVPEETRNYVARIMRLMAVDL